MKSVYHKASFVSELIVSGLFILFYFLLVFVPHSELWEIIDKSYLVKLTTSLCYLVPIIVFLSFPIQWSYYGNIENFLRRGTFTIIVLIPMFIVWGDWQFTFWLSGVHLFSSFISFYEQEPIQEKKENRFFGKSDGEALWGLSPSQVVLVSFVLLIISGTTLLMLPISTLKDVKLIDHLFMITSATCVTGLTTVNVGESYSLFGQIILLFCIQVGGLGIMTLSSSLTLFLGKTLAMKERMMMKDILDVSSLQSTVEIIIDIIKTTVVIEIIGAVILTGVFVHSGESFGHALYLGIFHSISAFCNAGISPIITGVEGYKTNVVFNLTVSMLIILGGIGFWVIKDLKKNISKVTNLKYYFQSLTLHSKVVLTTSFFLIFFGTIVIFLFDYMGSFSQYNLTEKMLIAFFHSVSARTAGFSTFNLAQFSSASLFIIIILMYIGASPGSTGGGIKTTTFAIIWQSILSTLKGKSDIEFFNRTVDSSLVLKSAALAIMSLMFISVVTALLLVFETDKTFLALIFEAVSAFCTVGLSVGITSSLTSIGKLLIIILMYVGRVGPLTLIIGISSVQSKQGIRYPKEKIVIG